ncbi:MAG: DUF4440 domain-containing protein [Anaerolineales bacterium]|nr:DUF4440 domain-containing protein [Anaerolineales bacterium]
MLTDDEKEILRLAKLLCTASETGDKETLEKIISDTYVCTGSGGLWDNYGKFGDKNGAVKKWGTPPPPGITGSTTISNEHVFVLDQTGIASYLIVDKWVDNAGEHEFQSWVTDIWIKQDGNWYLLATHETIFSES